MALKKEVQEVNPNDDVIQRAKDFLTRRQRPLMIISTIIILLAGGYLGYKYFILQPKEEKAQDALFKAEEYYRMDSLRIALNGDGSVLNPGLLKVIDKYGGTKSGNMAKYYAGVALLRTGDFQRAIKFLEDYKSKNKQSQTRAYKLLGDAYSETGNNEKAISYYKKAAAHFPEDEVNASEALYFAASLSERTGDTGQAIELFKELRDKYPAQWGDEAEKYLAKLGIYND